MSRFTEVAKLDVLTNIAQQWTMAVKDFLQACTNFCHLFAFESLSFNKKCSSRILLVVSCSVENRLFKKANRGMTFDIAFYDLTNFH